MNTYNKKLIGLTLAVAMVGAAFAGTATTTMMTSSTTMNSNPAMMSKQVMAVSNNVPGPSSVSMLVVSQGTAAPQVKINLNSPAMLTVYDQNGNVAFTQNLKAGTTTVDTTNFPLGNDTLVVTVNQAGSTFTMKQSVTVNAPVESGS